MATMPELKIQTRVEFRGVELMRDITAFLVRSRDAAGPMDGTQDATMLLIRIQAAIESQDIQVTASAGGSPYTPVVVKPESDAIISATEAPKE